MEHHPIRRFIDQTFPNQQAENKAKWAQFFIGKGYANVESLKKCIEEQWNAASNAIPSNILSEIRANLSINDRRLSPESKKQLRLFLNSGSTPDFILKASTEKGKPRKPQPSGCKRIGVMNNLQTLPLFLYEEKKLQNAKYYTLLMVGEDSSEKSTILNALVNKLTGMEFTDNWRWTLDHSNRSQASGITTYYVNDLHNRFNIRIIEAPDFGDINKIKANDSTIQKYQTLFNNIAQIDYVLLVVKATEKTLKGSKYLYTRMQQMLGADARDRFLLLSTSAEETTPLCVQTFQSQNLRFEKYFTFNSSALYNPSRDCTSHYHWRMCINSIQDLQDYIQKNRGPLGLNQSRKVLQARKCIEQSITSLHGTQKSMESELNVARQNLKNWKQYKKQIEQNRQYTKQYTVITFQRTPLGKTVPMCTFCQVSCCKVCVWPPNQAYSNCTYFNNGNNCPVCPGKCPRDYHVRTNDQIKKVTGIKAIVNETMKQAYEQAIALAQRYQNDFNRNSERIKSFKASILHLVDYIKRNLKMLQEIALQPRLWTDKSFYNQMMHLSPINKSSPPNIGPFFVVLNFG